MLTSTKNCRERRRPTVSVSCYAAEQVLERAAPVGGSLARHLNHLNIEPVLVKARSGH